MTSHDTSHLDLPTPNSSLPPIASMGKWKGKGKLPLHPNHRTRKWKGKRKDPLDPKHRTPGETKTCRVYKNAARDKKRQLERETKAAEQAKACSELEAKKVTRPDNKGGGAAEESLYTSPRR